MFLPKLFLQTIPLTFTDRWDRTFCLFPWIKLNIQSHRPERIFYEKTPLQSFTAYRSVFYATHRSSAYRRGDRHEILNELDYEQVQMDILSFIEKRLEALEA